jgi:hypothetical protein
MKTLTITIADTKAEFKIDLDTERDMDIHLEYGHKRATTTLMGFLQALGLVGIVEVPPLTPDDYTINN